VGIFVATLGAMAVVSVREGQTRGAPDRAVLATVGDIAPDAPRGSSGAWLDYRLYAVGLLAALGALLASLT
jgi:hypothetical protein